MANFKSQRSQGMSSWFKCVFSCSTKSVSALNALKHKLHLNCFCIFFSLVILTFSFEFELESSFASSKSFVSIGLDSEIKKQKIKLKKKECHQELILHSIYPCWGGSTMEFLRSNGQGVKTKSYEISYVKNLVSTGIQTHDLSHDIRKVLGLNLYRG